MTLEATEHKWCWLKPCERCQMREILRQQYQRLVRSLTRRK
jgi:hypothetical protein